MMRTRADVVVVVAATALSVSPIALLSALAALMREDLNFGPGELGLAVSVFFASSAFTSAPGGAFAERAGGGTALAVSVVGSCVAMLGIAVWVVTWPQALAVLAVAGVANGICQPAGNLVLAGAVSPGRQGIAFGLRQAAAPGAMLLAGMTVPSVGVLLGWRWAFGGAALTGLFLVVPAKRTRKSGVNRDGAQNSRTTKRILILLAAAAGMATASVGGIIGFMADFAVHSGLSPGAAGLLVAAGSASGIAVRIMAGWLADRRGEQHLPRIGWMVLVGGSGFVLLASGTSTATLVVGALLGYAAGWGWVGLFNLDVVQRNTSAPGAATGITQTGVFIGGVAGPLMFGVVVQTVTYGAAWLLSAAVSLLSILLFFWVGWELRRRPGAGG